MKLKRLSLFLALVMILSAFAGTFTFASAATAGGTFTINGGDPITGQICKQTLQDGDVIVLQSDYVVTATESGAFAAGITIDGNGHTVTMSARWFNYGYSTKPDADTTGNANYNVSFADKTLTFKNVKFVTTGACNGIVQSQNKDATIVIEDCEIHHYANDARGFITANGADQKIIVKGSQFATYNLAPTTNAGAGLLHPAATNTVVTVTDSDFRVATPMKAGGSNVATFIWAAATGAKINMSGVSMDSSLATYHRLINSDSGVASQTWSMDNSIFIGSNDSHDVFQTGKTTQITIGENVVFMGGGSNGTGKVIIRNYSGLAYYDASVDTYNQIKVLNRSNKYATDADLLKHFGKDPTVTGTDYDKAAAAMGYKARITDAATAYANGTFAGYYTCWKDVTNAVGLEISADTTITVIGDLHNAEERTNYTYTNSQTFTIKGVDADGDGVNPTIFSSTALYRANYTNTKGTLVYENLNFVMTNSWFGQLNFGTMTVKNCNIECGGTNGHGVVVQGGTIFNLIDSTIVYTGTADTSNNLRLNAAGCTVNITNSTVKTTSANAAPINVVQNSSLNITENSEVVVNGVKGIVVGSGKTLTLNGVEVTSSITAGAMLPGASVRIARGNELAQSGIRFESALTAAQIAAAEATGATVTYGTVVFKKADLGNKTVAELVAAANADANDALIVADIEAKDGIITDAEGNKTIRAAIINIKEKNYGVEFGAVAYIELTYADGATVRIYGAFDATNNVRSIKGVAELALADYEMEAGVVDGYNYYNEITVEIEGVETTVYSCYSDEQIAILNTYAGK